MPRPGRRAAASSAATSPASTWLGDLGPIDPHVHPHVALARTELSSLRDEEVFAIGRSVILDAVEGAAKGAAKGARMERE